MKKFKLIRNILLGAGLIAFIIYSISMFSRLDSEMAQNPTAISDTLISDYTNLFNQNTKQRLALKSTISPKLRHPISIYEYNKNYLLEITKMNLKPNSSLIKIIKETYAEASETNDIYIPLNGKYITVNYRSTSPDSVSKLYLKLDRNAVEAVLKNDSLVSYHLNLKSFSVQYPSENDVEIYAKSNAPFFLPNTKSVPVDIMFLRKNNMLYFLFLTVNQPNAKLDSNMLQNLITK